MDAKIVARPLPNHPGSNELTLVRRYRNTPVSSSDPSWLRRCADVTQLLPTHLISKR